MRRERAGQGLIKLRLPTGKLKKITWVAQRVLLILGTMCCTSFRTNLTVILQAFCADMHSKLWEERKKEMILGGTACILKVVKKNLHYSFLTLHLHFFLIVFIYFTFFLLNWWQNVRTDRTVWFNLYVDSLLATEKSELFHVSATLG